MLNSIKVGETARITELVAGDASYRAKLLALGLLPGTEVTLVRKAPLGDPIELEIRGYRLSLRKKEADLLRFERVN